jgi:hypothetical protein
MPLRSILYILDADHQPVPCEDVAAWSLAFADFDRNRRVAFDQIAPGVTVSTVFLGIDHGWGSSERPVLFETMAFDDYEDGQHQYRCCTWDEAEAQHKEVVALLRARIIAQTGP